MTYTNLAAFNKKIPSIENYQPVIAQRGMHITEMIVWSQPENTLIITSDLEHSSTDDLLDDWFEGRKFDRIFYNIYKGQSIDSFIATHKHLFGRYDNILIFMVGVNTYTGLKIPSSVSIDIKDRIRQLNPNVTIKMCRDAIHEFLLFEDNDYDKFDYILGYNHAIFGKELGIAGGWVRNVKELYRGRHDLYVNTGEGIFPLQPSENIELATNIINEVYEDRAYLSKFYENDFKIEATSFEGVTGIKIQRVTHPTLENTGHVVAFRIKDFDLPKDFVIDNTPLNQGKPERRYQLYDEVFPRYFVEPFIYMRASEFRKDSESYLSKIFSNLRTLLK